MKEETRNSSLKEEERKAFDRLKAKYPNAYLPEYDEESGLPVLADEITKDWED